MQRLSRGVALPCRVCLCHVDWGLKQRSFGISSIIFFTNITPSTTANVRNSGKRVHLSLRGGKYLSRLTASQLCWRLSPPTLSITTIQDNGSDEQGLGDGYPVSFLLIKMGSIHVDRPCCRRTFFACVTASQLVWEFSSLLRQRKMAATSAAPSMELTTSPVQQGLEVRHQREQCIS